jgi:hypothetical protein
MNTNTSLNTSNNVRLFPIRKPVLAGMFARADDTIAQSTTHNSIPATPEQVAAASGRVTWSPDLVQEMGKSSSASTALGRSATFAGSDRRPRPPPLRPPTRAANGQDMMMSDQKKGHDDLDCWLTVFGFTPDQTGAVLAALAARYGDVRQKRVG